MIRREIAESVPALMQIYLQFICKFYVIFFAGLTQISQGDKNDCEKWFLVDRDIPIASGYF